MPVLGIPSFQFALDLCARENISKIAANVHHLAEQTSQAIRFLEGGSHIKISDERSLLLGSGGGVVKGAEIFQNKPFFILNADTICALSLKDLAYKHMQLKSQYGVNITLAIMRVSPSDGKYSEIILDEKRGIIRGIGQQTIKRPFYTGIAVIEYDAIKHLSSDKPSDFVKDILNPSIQRGRAGFYCVENSLDEPEFHRWIDIGSPSLWHEAHFKLIKMMDQSIAPQIWANRILKSNHRVSDGIWISKKSPLSEGLNWSSPCYWSPDLNSNSPPLNLGPYSVLYGSPPEGVWDPVRSICFRSIYTKIE